LYEENDYFKLALIVSNYKQRGKYSNPKLKLHLLNSVFKYSLEKQVNLFNCKESVLIDLIESSFAQNRYYKNRVNNVKRVLLDQNFLDTIAKQVPKEKKLCIEHDLKYLVYEEDDFPVRLRQLRLSPLMIFYQGSLPTNEQLKKSIAVIGSRDIDQFGEQVAEKAGREVSKNNFWNISGLASGSDTYGHKGSLAAQGLTGAILGHGLAKDIYPPENKGLARQILKQDGFLLSEVVPSTKPQGHFFKWRDRLQSGLTRGVFVVETGEKGGTLHTVNYSLRQEREVFVWSPQNLENISEDKIEGNLMLTGRKEPTSNFKIKAKYKLKKITPVTSVEELIKRLTEPKVEQPTLL